MVMFFQYHITPCGLSSPIPLLPVSYVKGTLILRSPLKPLYSHHQTQNPTVRSIRKKTLFLIVALDTNLSFLFWITSSNWYYNNITFIQYLQQLDINLSIFMRIAYILSLLIVYFDNFYSISLIFLCVYYIILLSV